MSATPEDDDRIAIVGMACRVPGAADVETFWRNLVEGRESIETVSEAELRAAGVPEALLRDPRYVRAGGYLADIESFDGDFFGFTPREARCSTPAPGAAGVRLGRARACRSRPRRPAPARRRLRGRGQQRLLPRPRVALDRGRRTALAYQALIGSERDFAATRVAYMLDCDGPRGRTCRPPARPRSSRSTSPARRSSPASATWRSPAAWRCGCRSASGYLHEEGRSCRRDGHCRAFAATRSGTVIGNGAGIVALRRLADALADGDTVHAVILGSAVNNDGARKVGLHRTRGRGTGG